MDVRIPGWQRSSTSRQWFVTLRLLEVAALALLVGTCIQLWTAWSATADFDPVGTTTSATPDIPFMSRVTSVVFFHDLRATFVSLLVVAAVVALGVGVLLHQGPVANGRLVRWELLALWSAAMLVALVILAFHVLALFGEDPFATQDDTPSLPPQEGFRPSMLVQLVAGVSWPAAGALFLAASGLWWVRLPRDLESDEEDVGDEDLHDPYGDDGHAADGREPDGREAAEAGPAGRGGDGADDAGRDGAARIGAGADPRRPREPVGSRPRPRTRSRARPGARTRQGRDNDRDDVLVLDGVEQIEPVERLTPRGSGADDGGTPSGYDDYFRRM